MKKMSLYRHKIHFPVSPVVFPVTHRKPKQNGEGCHTKPHQSFPFIFHFQKPTTAIRECYVKEENT